MKRIAGFLRVAAGVTALFLTGTAHVGTLDVFFRGNAGPYPVQVTIRPPGVVPGLAQVIVRTADSAVTRVTTQAAVWNRGSKGAPAPDDAIRSPSDPALWTSELWLMTRGSYAINVRVSGPRGSGTVAVPYTSVATRQLRMAGPLGWILGGLGIFLVVGLVSIIGTAARESMVAPGAPITPRQVRRGRLAIVGGTVVLLLGLTGGRSWWNAVDTAYRRSLFRPMDATLLVTRAGDGGSRLRLAITDSGYVSGGRTPIIPDHGKPVHLFLVGEENSSILGHLHPVQLDRSTFESPVPALPAGHYRFFADIVMESGNTQTLTGQLMLGDHPPSGHEGDHDDALFLGVASSDSTVRLDGGLTVTFSRPANVMATAELPLRFVIRDSSGAIVSLEPYMGMPGHAMVAKTDGQVFAHLHSNGSFSMAAQQVLEAVERGDTLASLVPNVPRPRLDATHDPSHLPAAPGELEFPFAFPTPGNYVIWVQFRHGAVRTAAFSVKAGGAIG